MTNYVRPTIREPDRAHPVLAIDRWLGSYFERIAEFSRNKPVSGAFLAVFAVFLTVLFTLMTPFSAARAQDGIMSNGDLAVTGFSGTKDVGGQTFIDTDGISLKVLSTSGKGSASAQVINAPTKFQANARDIGQVFGVALDNAPNPNIYATSTSVLGLQIVTPDSDGDGVPERVNTGQAAATFMDGQFGTALGGGPGTVWRIDGTTGQVSVFADIAFDGVANSGPGLGNIAFDPAHYQFYVSDLDTGMIHRLDLSGNDLGTFDHGLEGRAVAGLPAVAMNPANRMDITSAAFDATNPGTWGLADEQRRVWGLAYYKGRLYYAVAGGSQIWSVGIAVDGSFAADAQIEIQSVPGGNPVSDILFTPQGRMVLAQRGGILGSHDYSAYHQPKQNRVLRYQRDLSGNWIEEPDEYAIGFPVNHRNASGGVGLACDGTLWSTGDALRNDPALAAQLSAGGPLAFHGLQGNSKSLVRPFNVPPWSSWFIDYNGQPANETDAGHVGDVEVYRNCAGGRTESFPGWYPIPEWYPPEGWIPPVWWPRTPDLELEKIANECVADPAAPGSLLCDYTVVVTNFGAADFVGHLNVTDNPPATAVFVPPAGGSIPWTCAQPGGAGTPIDCQSDNVETLHPGESETLDITIQVTPAAADKYIENCVILDEDHHGDDPNHHGLNEDCDEAELPRPDLETRKKFWKCEPEGANQRCYFILEFENVGPVPYTGPLHFVENIPAGTIFGAIHLSTTPGWACVGGPPVECTLPDPPGVTMNPGDVEGLLISIIVPPAVSGELENCVELGHPTHADDPEAPGVNKACAPFTVVPLFAPQCPAGWQEVPPAGAPAGWQMIAIHGFHPDGTGWALMCMRPQPPEGGDFPIVNPDPQPAPPSCKPGEHTFNLPHQVPQGWSKRKVTNGVITIWCATPPLAIPHPKCRPDETKFSKLQDVPQGWSRRKVTKGNVTIWCAKPGLTIPLPTCRPGETKFASANQVPSGWTKRKVSNGQVTFWCARPGLTIPAPTCRPGEKKFANGNQVPSGWTKRKVTNGQVTFWCARPGLTTPLPTCRRGEKKFASAKQVPSGWTKRKVSNGQVTFWCARPGLTTPLPTCRRGEKKFASAKQVPSGWTKRKVSNGKVTIWCARPGLTTPSTPTVPPKPVTPPKPKCVGGKVVMLKTMPPRWRCICPPRTKNVKGTCQRPKVKKTPPKRVTPKPPPKRVTPRPQTTPPKRVQPRPQVRPTPRPQANQKPKARPATRVTPPAKRKLKKRTNPSLSSQQTGQRRVVR